MERYEGISKRYIIVWCKHVRNVSFQLPPLMLKSMLMEHAFVSNFKKPTMTAALHANSMTSSMAGKLSSFRYFVTSKYHITIWYPYSVQFVGKKSWIFFSPDVYRNANMLNAYQTDSTSLVTQSPKDNYDVYVYTSQPGDVLFFAENWVITIFVVGNYKFLYILYYTIYNTLSSKPFQHFVLTHRVTQYTLMKALICW